MGQAEQTRSIVLGLDFDISKDHWLNDSTVPFNLEEVRSVGLSVHLVRRKVRVVEK